MRIRKDKMVKAIDHIIAEHDKRRAAYDKALPQWERERQADWIRVWKPRWKQLQTLIANTARNETINYADVAAIFPPGRYNTAEPHMQAYHPDLDPPPTLVFNNGRKVSRPTGINVNQMQAMKKLLEAVEDDTVTDTVLSRLGVKDVTPIFRAAVELGGLVG